jgi:hypothetical protein
VLLPLGSTTANWDPTMFCNSSKSADSGISMGLAVETASPKRWKSLVVILFRNQTNHCEFQVGTSVLKMKSGGIA